MQGISALSKTNPSMHTASQGKFGMSGQKKAPFGIRSNREGLKRLADLLRKLEPVKTADSIASETTLSVDTVRKWLRCESAPNVFALAVLVANYGPQILTAFYSNAPAWLDSATRADQLAALEAESEQLRIRMEALR